MASIARNARQLKQRLRHFLNSQRYGIPQVAQCLAQLQQLGDVAIFGGMLRDLALGGSRAFCSDVDLVLQGVTSQEIEAALQKHGYVFERNRYGGFRIRLDKWLLDVWALQDTWAFSQGYFIAQDFSSLLQTTFFTWDAIVFDCQTQSVLCAADYFEKLQSLQVDINLAQNPNPLGITVRCLRYVVLAKAALSASLTTFLVQQLQQISHGQLLQSEQASYGKSVLSLSRLQRIQLALEHLPPDGILQSPWQAQQLRLDLN